MPYSGIIVTEAANSLVMKLLACKIHQSSLLTTAEWCFSTISSLKSAVRAHLQGANLLFLSRFATRSPLLDKGTMQ